VSQREGHGRSRHHRPLAARETARLCGRHPVALPPPTAVAGTRHWKGPHGGTVDFRPAGDDGMTDAGLALVAALANRGDRSMICLCLAYAAARIAFVLVAPSPASAGPAW